MRCGVCMAPLDSSPPLHARCEPVPWSRRGCQPRLVYAGAWYHLNVVGDVKRRTAVSLREQGSSNVINA